MAAERADVADLQQRLLKAAKEQKAGRQRYGSWCDAAHRVRSSPELQRQRQLREPGGFRRGFLHTRAEEEGIPHSDWPDTWKRTLVTSLRVAGKLDSSAYGLELDDEDVTTPLTQDDNKLLSNSGVALATFKANIGCAVLYMPRAWKNGGYGVAAIIFPVVGLLAIVSALRLLQCRSAVPGSYGDLLAAAGGPRAHCLINTCIVLLQSGVCSSYFIVAANLLQSTYLPHMSSSSLILLQLVLYIPLSTVHHLAKLWPLTMVGTLLVIAGILSVIGMECADTIHSSRLEKLEAANSHGWLVCLGTACFMFEGIGLVLPTYDCSKDTKSFPAVYSATMLFALLLVSTLGCLGYLTYGDKTESLILLNFPVNHVQGAIRMAFVAQVFCSFPLQLLPAVRLVEDHFFTKYLKPLPPSRETFRTTFRALYVCFLSGVAMFGSRSLDNFVSLLGALCGIPLAFVFPAICHFCLARQGLLQRVIDAALVIVGMGFTCLITVANIRAWVSPVG